MRAPRVAASFLEVLDDAKFPSLPLPFSPSFLLLLLLFFFSLSFALIYLLCPYKGFCGREEENGNGSGEQLFSLWDHFCRTRHHLLLLPLPP